MAEKMRQGLGCGLDVVGCGTENVIRDDRSLGHSVLRGRFGSGTDDRENQQKTRFTMHGNTCRVFGKHWDIWKSINASLNDAKYDYKLKKYCSNEGIIYTELLGELAYQNNSKFKKFIVDNSLGFKAYASFGKNEITERIAVLIDLVKLVWNDDMFI